MSNSLSTTLPATGYATVLPRELINGSDAEVVDANVEVVNAMYAELLDIEEISPNALRSYYVDFYLTQSLGGGFAQYVFTAPDREDIDAYVRAGLENMGASAHLDLFNRTVAAFDALSEEDADAYLDRDADLDADRRAARTSRTRSGAWRSSTASSKRCWKPRTSSRSTPPGSGASRTSWSWTTRNSTATSPSGCPGSRTWRSARPRPPRMTCWTPRNSR